MTTTSDQPKRIKITMSERRPLSIVEDEWPLIASADRHDGKVACQANHHWTIRVREHADGRRLVYGWLRAGQGGVHIGWRGAEGGFLVAATDAFRDAGPGPLGHVPDDEATVRAIRRIGGIIDDDRLADECIADLPAERLDVPAPDEVRMPREGARRLLATMDRIIADTGVGIDPGYASELRAVADELRRVLTERA